MFEDIVDKHIRGRSQKPLRESEQPQAPVDDDNADLPLAETDLVERLFNLLTCVFYPLPFKFTHAFHSVP